MLWRGRLTLAAGASLLALMGAQLFPGSPEAGTPPIAAAVDEAATPLAATSPERLPLPESPGSDAQPPRDVASPARPAGVTPEALGHLPLVQLRAAASSSEPRQRIRLPGPSSLQLEYTLDPVLNDKVFSILRRGGVSLGLAVVLDATSGDVLAYAGTDESRLPHDRAYPAASLVKIVTAAAAIEQGLGARPCRFVGSPYRLTPGRIVPPRGGTRINLAQALATSNNQCFAQLAAGPLGAQSMLEAIDRFGLVEAPAPAHEAGRVVDPGGDRYLLGKLGCGLAGLHITALHAAELASVLADGELHEVRWLARATDSQGRELALPARRAPRRVVDAAVARQLRQMLVETSVRGTARRAFRRHARSLLGAVRVASKTGSLTGSEPPGRYEWFVAAAPVERPRIALAVLVVQGERWSSSGADVGAQILSSIFCEKRSCSASLAGRFGVRDTAVRSAARAGVS